MYNFDAANVRPTISLMDDEQTQRHLISAQLKKQGYNVRKGEKAIILWGKPIEIAADTDTEAEANHTDDGFITGHLRIDFWLYPELRKPCIDALA